METWKHGLAMCKHQPCNYLGKGKNKIDNILIFLGNEQKLSKAYYCQQYVFKFESFFLLKTCFGLYVYRNRWVEFERGKFRVTLGLIISVLAFYFGRFFHGE